MMRCKRIFSVAFIPSLFIFACMITTPAIAAKGAIELNVAWFGPATHVVTTEAAQPWIADMEKASGGKLKLNLFSGGTLVSAADTWQAVSSGLADIGIGYVGYTPGRFSLAEVVSLPFLNISSGVSGSKILWQLYNENEEVRSQFSGAKILFLYTNSPAQLHSTKKPVSSLEDIKGMTVRCPGSIAPIFKALGASPAVMGADEAYEALERGVVDSTTFPWEALKSYKISEVTHFHTVLNHYVGPYFVAMNKDAWQKLPSDLQKAIEASCGEKGAVLFGGAYDKADSYGLDLIKKGDHKIINLSEAEMGKLAKSSEVVWDEWLQVQNKKGLNGKQVLDRVIQLAKEYSK